MRALLALSFLLAALPLRANEIDYFCLFTNAAAAQANPAVGAYWHPATSDGPGDWDRSQTNPGLSVVTPQAIVNGVSSATGFWIMISTFGPKAALDADTSCVMKLDRDAAVAGYIPGVVVAPRTISSITNASGTTAIVTTAAPHGLSSHSTANIVGASPAGFNGGYTITVTGASTFTYQLGTAIGSPAAPVGTYTATLPATSANTFATSSVITGANRTALTFSPVPLGSRYPLPVGQ